MQPADWSTYVSIIAAASAFPDENVVEATMRSNVAPGVASAANADRGTVHVMVAAGTSTAKDTGTTVDRAV